MQQPDDSSYDERLRELAFARMVDRGLRDSGVGRTGRTGTSGFCSTVITVSRTLPSRIGDIDVLGVFHGALEIERCLL